MIWKRSVGRDQRQLKRLEEVQMLPVPFSLRFITRLGLESTIECFIQTTNIGDEEHTILPKHRPLSWFYVMAMILNMDSGETLMNGRNGRHQFQLENILSI